MIKKFATGLLGAAFLATSLVSGTGALAGSVVLNANDGSISARGEFVGFENGYYKIRTALGELTFSADTVTCEGDSCPDLTPVADVTVDVLIRGSESMGVGLMPLMLAGYANNIEAGVDIATSTDNHGSQLFTLIGDGGYGEDIGTFEVESTNSDDAFASLLERSSQIGMSTRRITRDEARALAKDGSGLMTDISQEHIIAVDSIAVIVNPENPVNSLSIQQLASIYKGEITNWKQLGGNNERIVVYSRQGSSNTRSVFEKRILGSTSVTTVARVVGTNRNMAARVNVNPGAIGFVGYAYLNGTKPLELVSECGIVTTPDSFSAKTESYPLSRRLYLYNRGDNLSALAGDFLSYAVSSDADGIIDKAGFINLGIERITHDQEVARIKAEIANTTDPFEQKVLREMLAEMVQWDRLSTTFRFAAASDRLERKSTLDMVRLVDYLSTQPEGTEVAFVGFTDNDGVFGANRALSIKRAEEAIKQVNDYAGDQLSHISFTPLGYGELKPSACNLTNAGKGINRRVEVWIRSGS